jgi:hypothetical protein
LFLGYPAATAVIPSSDGVKGYYTGAVQGTRGLWVIGVVLSEEMKVDWFYVEVFSLRENEGCVFIGYQTMIAVLIHRDFGIGMN